MTPTRDGKCKTSQCSGWCARVRWHFGRAREDASTDIGIATETRTFDIETKEMLLLEDGYP